MTAAEILSLPVQATPKLILASDDGRYYAIPAGGSGADAKVFVTQDVLNAVLATPTDLTPDGALDLPVPEGAPIRGSKAKYFITPTAECVLTMAAGIVIPSRSEAIPYTIPANALCIVQLEYSGTFWMLTTIVGDYTTPV